MAIKIGKYEQSDVTFWGVSAVIAVGIAVVSTSFYALVPTNIFGSLHASRIAGGTLNQLRAQVDHLNNAQRELLRTTNQLRSQFTLSERERSTVNQRVGALEVSIPMLLEVVPPGADIDPLSITASIDDSQSESFDAEGGSVTISHSPLFEGAVPEADNTLAVEQALPPEVVDLTAPPEMPEEIEPQTSLKVIENPQSQTGEAEQQNVANVAPSAYGIAVGEPVTLSTADAMWQQISSKVGTLLIGLEPAVSDPLQNDSLRVVFGPLTNFSEAEMLCRRISAVGIECLPIQYADQQIDAL